MYIVTVITGTGRICIGGQVDHLRIAHAVAEVGLVIRIRSPASVLLGSSLATLHSTAGSQMSNIEDQ
jgi:hypothetical protein